MAWQQPHCHHMKCSTHTCKAWEIALGNFMTLEIDWKQNGNKRLQSFSLENFWKQKRLQNQTVQKNGNFFTYKPNSQKKLETFSLTNQTVKKNWKLFELENQHQKKFGKKRLETFSLTNQTVKKNWKLFNVLSKQFKKFGNFFTLLALEISMAGIIVL